ncbi:MAG TPA: type II secretion system protein [Alphaproteobacteria bacterium]
MKKNLSQRGLSLVEITVVVLVIGILIIGSLYGLRVVQNAKIKAHVIQISVYQNAAQSFRKQYGTWPGDFAQATTMLNDCNAVRQCEDGNGDQVVASRNNSTDCRMPAFTTAESAFPCAPAAAASVANGSELTQFWRHLALSRLITDLRMRPFRYNWGDSMPKTRITGGIQLIYEGNNGNNFVNGLTGHFFTMSRDPRVLVFNMNAAGNGMIAIDMAETLDKEMDDGLPNTGNFRAVGNWGCGGPGETNAYNGTALRQCTTFYKFDQ